MRQSGESGGGGGLLKCHQPDRWSELDCLVVWNIQLLYVLVYPCRKNDPQLTSSLRCLGEWNPMKPARFVEVSQLLRRGCQDLTCWSTSCCRWPCLGDHGKICSPSIRNEGISWKSHGNESLESYDVTGYRHTCTLCITHTHLIRTAIANFDVECIGRAETEPKYICLKSQ